jgi:hypothetical protein
MALDQTHQTQEPTLRKPLRLWPGVALAVLLLLIRFVVPVVVSESMMYAILGGLAGGVAILLWWLFFSRAPWLERLGVIGLAAAALFVASRLVHVSIAKGAMGMLFPILAAPVLGLALVAGAVAGRRLSAGSRRAVMAAALLLACGSLTLLRTGGFTGEFDNDLHWRWTETPEERLLAQEKTEPVAAAPAAPAAAPEPVVAVRSGDEPAVPSAVEVPEETPGEKPAASPAAEPAVAAVPAPAPAAVETRAEWPGFRGAARDGNVRGVRIATDWSASPPVELWRRPIGPGWSSFAVQGDLVYTQEQRGDDEVVACYSLKTGEPVWRHRDAARFWESNAGAGPRATPTLDNGHVYTLGATGILNALDARDGSVVWMRDAAADTGAKLPVWGFSGSPLVVGNTVVVAVSGALAAYDATTGAPRWSRPAPGDSYSSPQLATIGGVSQILLLNQAGANGFAPADGTPLWQHAWKGYPIVQPAVTQEGDLLISVSDRGGTRRVAVAKGPGGWTAEERWTSIFLKPYFNDFVIHKGHAFGFDGTMLASINVQDGKRDWKGGRYGHGQLVLLPDQDLLLVLSEEGELALVKAAADQFTELARFPAIEGKTWNHPVLAGDVLLVRNDQEMAAFRLSLAGGQAESR